MAKDSSSGWSSALVGGAETIVAQGCAPGRGALAVVRVSGPDAQSVAGVVCPGLDFDAPWRARLVEFLDSDGAPIEKGVAIPYRAPMSYTGEDMVEAMIHGSPYLVDRVVEAFLDRGARPAQPGEFTRRAMANGKMDLVQAEAVRDLIAAETARQASNAQRQMAGHLSAEFQQLRSELLDLQVRLEGSLDFAAHGVNYQHRECREQLHRCRQHIAELLATAEVGERIRDGVRVVIAGPTNSGKSTLFNRLVGTERAIVTPHPGTTRDVVEAELEINGLRIVLADTAGLRETEDPVEREGVDRARAAVAMAQVVVQLWPVDEATHDQGLPASAAADGAVILDVRSKADLATREERGARENMVAVSGLTGQGMEELRSRLHAAVGGEVAELGDRVAIATRHRRILERMDGELARADERHPEVVAEAARWALREIEELAGKTTVDDVLDEVFRTFCIGK